MAGISSSWLGQGGGGGRGALRYDTKNGCVADYVSNHENPVTSGS